MKGASGAAIVIPAFNEAASIGKVVEEVRVYGTPVVVDDGSADDTGARATKAGATVVRHANNQGYDAALQSGFAAAEKIGAEAILTFDADGQLDAGAIPLALAALADGRTGFVLGTRDSGAARWSEALFNLYARVRFGVPDILCGLKAFRIDGYAAHRGQLAGQSINTALALTLLRKQVPFKLVPVGAKPRMGLSRFGQGWRANRRFLRALGGAVMDDVLGR